jgi:hypothetical protein
METEKLGKERKKIEGERSKEQKNLRREKE